MMKLYLLLLLFTVVSAVPPLTPTTWLAQHSKEANQQENLDVVAQWNYYTNTITANSIKSAQADAIMASFSQSEALTATTLMGLNSFQNLTPDQQRRFNKITDLGIYLNKSQTVQLSTYVNDMTAKYSNYTLCQWVGLNHTNCSLPQWSLDPDIFNLLASSQNYDELAYVWNAWRTKTSALKPTWLKFMQLSNAGARAGGYPDTGAYWRSWYEQKNFTTTIQNLYYQILPMYETLHTYVRRQLQQKYPNRWNTSTIPAHILGNMWAQEWQNIASTSAPLFKNAGTLDVTQAMIQQNYNATRMFRTAESFFKSLGLGAMVPTFWTKSIITKPKRIPTNFVCHASAWDFYTGKDFRIKMCTSVDMNNLITIHHEMGHIEYFMQYSIQPNAYRNGANPGFHEAIGDTIALSVATPTHLKKINLLPSNFTINQQQDLNFLYKQALEKVAFLPWGYLMDKWRWNVFNGKYNATLMNDYWWYLRYSLQGLHPPVARPPTAFDPAAKSHIDDNTPYIRYFVSFIVQFQFYESMCKAANNTLPLHLCDFYNSKPAGQKLMNMLSMGASKPWPQAMQVLTGQNQMSAASINRYFAPLMVELKKRNAMVCDCYGWGNDVEYPPSVLKTLPTPRCPGLPNNSWSLPKKCSYVPPTTPGPRKTTKKAGGGASSVQFGFALLLPFFIYLKQSIFM